MFFRSLFLNLSRSLALIILLSLGLAGCQCSKNEQRPEVVEDVMSPDELDAESEPEEALQPEVESQDNSENKSE